MRRKRRQSYPYTRAEWWGVVFALFGTPPLLDQLLDWIGVLRISPSLGFTVFFGGVAGTGWALLALGARAHRRADPPTSV